MEDRIAPIFTLPVQLKVQNEVLKIQTDEYSKANIINDVLNKDINTMRRQVEIIEDSSLRTNNTIFILKTCTKCNGRRSVWIPVSHL